MQSRGKSKLEAPMAPRMLSSGDLIADRRYGIGRKLAGRGDLSAAADLFEQVIERAPQFAPAWFALGEIRERSGSRDAALQAFENARDLDPSDAQGAGLRIARLRGRTEPMPRAYVRSLFDEYAPRYERAVVGELGYCVPGLLRHAVEGVRHAGDSSIRFRRALDLGCGTGLAGEAFRDCCDAIVGIDISHVMIDHARRKHIYCELRAGDLVEALEADAGRADLAIAADVLIYVPDLGRVARAAARVLEPQGLFALSVETHAGAGVVLTDKLRYAHAPPAVRVALEAAGFTVAALSGARLRNEAGAPVAGLIAVGEMRTESRSA
jgi:predicted TPR repeat methyltransferase